MRSLCCLVILACGFSAARAQEATYANLPPADPPYFRVRYEASTKPGELAFPASFTVWVPPGVSSLRGVVVHQHGCGVGSCTSGQTGAFDLHWQALARKHQCALLSPVYEQPEMANCQLWCDPRNGSDAVFQKALSDLGRQSGHPELERVPWALWGHSGGGYWVGGMALLHPDRVAAAWLRSGVPPITAKPDRPMPYEISEPACQVPLMCNLGTKEGVSDREGRFSRVWPGVEEFFKAMRSRGALIGVSIDPLSSHDCGNQRYLAMPWFDACLTARLPGAAGEPLHSVSAKDGWIAPLNDAPERLIDAVPAAKFTGPVDGSVWLPGEAVARAWKEYSTDTRVSDTTRPPAPTDVQVSGKVVTWSAQADLESGLAGFVIERDGQVLVNLPDKPRNPFGRPLFQGLSYSDTPVQPLAAMRYVDESAQPGKTHTYRVYSLNTAGLKSE